MLLCLGLMCTQQRLTSVQVSITKRHTVAAWNGNGKARSFLHRPPGIQTPIDPYAPG
jgi:hypothetical protein